MCIFAAWKINVMNAIIIGILLPLLGTMLGSAFVFFMKKEIPDRMQKTLLGFASGVMVAASVWSWRNSSPRPPKAHTPTSPRSALPSASSWWWWWMWCWASPQIGRIRAATTSATQERLTFLAAKLVLQDERTGNPMFIMMAKNSNGYSLLAF